MKPVFLLFAMVLLLAIFKLQAQEDTVIANKNRNLKNFIGLGVGYSTGIGFSYRYVPNKIGFQFTAGPFYNDYGDNAFYSFGLTFLKKIAKHKTNNVYFYLGNHYAYGYAKDVLINFLNNYNFYYGANSNNNAIWNTGAGLDFEYCTEKKIVLNIMAGYAQFNSFEGLFFTFETALYYKF